MITFDDIQSFVIDDMCWQSWPCKHCSTVTLKDGRVASHLLSFQVASIVSALANEKINPQGGWSADEVKEHFKEYDESSEWGSVEPPIVVLNAIFENAIFTQITKG